MGLYNITARNRGLLRLGDDSVGPYPVADDATEVELVFDRASWLDETSKLTFILEQATDGGKWEPLLAAEAYGGVTPRDRPQESSILSSLNPGKNRQVRGRFTVAGKPFTCQISVRGK